MKERQDKIFAIIADRPNVTVKELSTLLKVSEVTIRKDLSALENSGVLRRTHGGVAQVSSDSTEKRLQFRYNEKLKIAREAVKFVEDGDCILIEAGSTNTIFAKELVEQREVKIITNSLYIPKMLKDRRNVHITVLGGYFQPEAEAMVGPLTKLLLSNISVNKAFIGMDGFSEKLGFTCGDFMRAEIGKEMCDRAEKVFVLSESSKFENVGLTTVAEFSKIDTVVSDDGIPAKIIEILKKHQINTIIAK